MDQNHTPDEYEELHRQIEDLMRQNHILRLEHELRDLDQFSGLMSTPAHVKEEHALGPKKGLSAIPKGRPEDAHGAEAGLAEMRSLDSHDMQDRFVTTRKKQPNSTAKPKDVVMKPATYDGSIAWMDYRAHFEACAELNHWTKEQKGLYLSVSLRGQAQGVFGNLGSKKHDYDDLVKVLEERFAPPNQTELYRVQLRERRQKASESMAELGQDIRRLTNLAYPKAPNDVRETLAKEQFVDSLVSSEMRLKIKQARPIDLNDAVRHAVELEAFYRAENKQMGQGYIRATASGESSDDKKWDDAFLSLRKTVEEMTKTMNNFMSQQLQNMNTRPRGRIYNQGQNSNNRPADPQQRGLHRQARRCFNCNSDKHLIKDCPKPKGQNKEKKDSTETQEKGSVCLSSTNHAGLFVQSKFGDYNADCLVDSGATLTLLSSKVWTTIKGSETLEKFDRDIISASGDVLDTKGKTRVCFEINGNNCVMDVVVTEMDIDAIIGLDFMLTHNVVIDVVSMTMHVNGKKCDLMQMGKIGCYRVIVTDRVAVPSRSEIILEGKLVNWENNDDSIGIVESSERFLESNRGIVARTLVKGGKNVPIRVANFSNESQILYPGTNIAEFSPVQVIRTVQEIKPKPPRNLPKHLTDLFERTSEGMSSTQKKQIASLLGKYGDIFSKSENDLGRTGIIKHKISVGDSRPIKQAMRRVPVHLQDEVDRQINQMLEHDIIQPSASPWASAIVLVKKKDGSRRFCIDYRRLNDLTIKDAYLLPRIDESLDQLAGFKWFSCLDLSAGYWQVEVEPEDKPKTAFITRRGLFEFNVMPFGLCNAPATFERIMELVLSGLHWQICLIYLDDIIVFGRSFSEMIQNLDLVLGRFAQAGLKLKPQKCQLFKKEVEFLGHVINEHGVHTDPRKIECIKNWPLPKDIKEVRSFLGLCSYYRRFIENYSHEAKPLNRLTEKYQKFNWTQECSDAFEKLKHMLITAPILAHPDFSKPFILDTDASNQAIGAVLSQKVGTNEKVIAYASRTLSKAERKYCVTRKELLALVYFVKYFRHYLYGRRFTARTDHGSLRWLMNFKNPEGQVARWLEVLSAFDMAIEHRPGRLHSNADGLSRIPYDSTKVTAKEGNNHQAKQGCMQLVGLEIGNQLDETVNLEVQQAADNELSTVLSWIKSNKRPDFNIIAAEGYTLKSLWHQFPCLELHDGLLVRRLENDDDGTITYQAIVPRDARRPILNACHDMKTSGHLGVSKTASKIKQKFYWPGLQADVRIYVAGCEACSKRKGPIPSKRAPMQIVRSGYPMERIAIDILGELPQTENGNKYIVVIADYFTKWTEALPIPNIEACTVAKVLVEEVLCRFGVPQTIHSDQGRQFESNLFQEMCKVFGIEKTRTTPYHPQSDGMVERFNRTLATMLTMYVSTNQRDWDAQLPYVMMAYRSAEHETTGLSPNMLMFGHEVSTPLDLMFELPQLSKPVPNNQWVWEMRDRIETAHKLVRENIHQSMHRQKRIRDSRLSYEIFEEGDQVFVYFPVKKIGTSAKLTPFWKGPYQITGKLSDILYKVNCGRNRTNQIIHCDRIKQCKQQILRGEIEQTELLSDANENVDNDSSIDDENADTEEVVDVPEVNIEQGEDSVMRRTRRKPVWAKDYVFSCRMPNTKQTPRAPYTVTQPPKTKCTWCKGLYETGENFERHMVQCFRSRWTCFTCGETFMKKSYLNKHRENVHNARILGSSIGSKAKVAKTLALVTDSSATITQKDTAKTDSRVKEPNIDTKKAEKLPSGADKDEDSDWKQSPSISIGSVNNSDESKSSSDSEGVERHDEEVTMQSKVESKSVKDKTSDEKSKLSEQELLKGRLFRKATVPQKPTAPLKRKSETSEDLTLKIKFPFKQMAPEKEILVKCTKKGDNNASCEQETIVCENGDMIYKNSLCQKRQTKDTMVVKIGDLLPQGQVKTSSIELCISKEAQVELKFKYKPDGE